MDITNFIVTHRREALSLGDYGVYRKQLSRKLLTLRRRLGQATGKNRKFTPKAAVTADDISKDADHVDLLLLTSERAWAQAMYMKSLHAADNSKAITGSTRKHIASRLHKAYGIAAHLAEVLEQTALKNNKSRFIREAEGYKCMLKGAADFETQKWQHCLEAYSESHLIYLVLGKSSDSVHHDIFQDLLSTTINPSIRYAAYQLRLPRTSSIPKIVSKFLVRDTPLVRQLLAEEPHILSEGGQKRETDGEAKDVPSKISWRSRTVNLEDATIAQSLAAVSSAEKKLVLFLSSATALPPRERAAAYDDVLIPSQDAVDATKTAIEEMSLDGVSQSDQRMQALQITRTAVNYALVGWRIGRNRILCGNRDGAILEVAPGKKSKRPRLDRKETVNKVESTGRKATRLRERVVLYDATLQSLDSVKDLPGVAADSEFMAELEAKRSYFAALRCLAIARSHDLLGNRKNALALLSRASSLSMQAISHSESRPLEEPPKLDITSEEAGYVKDLVMGLLLQHRALVEIHSLNAANEKEWISKSVGQAPLVERLDEYPPHGADLTNLVSYPPKLSAVPVKPLFLDVAWNYVQYPGHEKHAVDTRANGVQESGRREEEKKETKKGWFGFGR